MTSLEHAAVIQPRRLRLAPTTGAECLLLKASNWCFRPTADIQVADLEGKKRSLIV
jgi:hypothetical protein